MNPGTANLVSYWSLEEASGTRVDAHGSNDLTDNNTVTNATGIQGNAASMLSANSEYLSITDAAQTGLNPSSELSIVGWFNLNRLPSTAPKRNMGLVGKKLSNSNQDYLVTFNSFDNDLEFLIIGNATVSKYETLRSTNPFVVAGDIGNWVMFACTFNVTGRIKKMYKNGSEVAASGASVGAMTTIYNGNSTFSIGRGNFADANAYVDGLVDEVAFFNKELTASEVSWLYNSGAGRSYTDITGGGGAAAFIPRVSMIT